VVKREIVTPVLLNGGRLCKPGISKRSGQGLNRPKAFNAVEFPCIHTLNRRRQSGSTTFA
jgi:hypothetical protein